MHLNCGTASWQRERGVEFPAPAARLAHVCTARRILGIYPQPVRYASLRGVSMEPYCMLLYFLSRVCVCARLVKRAQHPLASGPRPKKIRLSLFRSLLRGLISRRATLPATLMCIIYMRAPLSFS